MNENRQNLELYKCFIQAGQLAFSKDPSLICAVCGNGVLITLRDRIQKVGGVVHCIYPQSYRWSKPTNYHVDIAIYSLFSNLKNYNVIHRNLEAQLLGGGHLRGLNKKRAEKVIKGVRKILGKHNINIVSEDVGGNLGRKIIFNTESGELVIHKTRQIRKTDWMPEFSRK
ncbi:MAG: chemotaxis protein CheD [Candidatus Omnitrophica bacterium]|nr:chemotaxis protein CheD [Candidatus Omnitrophota bacterium]